MTKIFSKPDELCLEKRFLILYFNKTIFLTKVDFSVLSS